MRQSEQALRQSQAGQAVPPQTVALDQLQQGLQGLVDQVMEQMATQGQGMPNRPAQQNERGRESLGRPLPNSGGYAATSGHIPATPYTTRDRETPEQRSTRTCARTRPQRGDEQQE